MLQTGKAAGKALKNPAQKRQRKETLTEAMQVIHADAEPFLEEITRKGVKMAAEYLAFEERSLEEADAALMETNEEGEGEVDESEAKVAMTRRNTYLLMMMTMMMMRRRRMKRRS